VTSSKHDLRSVCQSVTSLLVTIAIDRKLIAGINEKVIKFLPEYARLVTAEWQHVYRA
jgi:CubicO group peptidase (beta-lactamase class C family)